MIARGALALCSVLVTLALLEAVLRVISPPSVLSARLPLRPSARVQMRLNIPGMPPSVVVTTNRWGLRGDEPPTPAERERVSMILAVGGSTTQCVTLDDVSTWPAQLQRGLRGAGAPVWVGNAGIDGHSTRGHLLFMSEAAPKVKPDVVLFLVGINDLLLSLRSDWLEHGNGYDALQMSWRTRVYANSRLAQWAATTISVATGKSVTAPVAHGRFVPEPVRDEAVSPDADLRAWLPGLNEYHLNVRRLIEMTRALGARPVFLTQPMLFDDTPYWRGIAARFAWLPRGEMRGELSAATVWRMEELYNRELLRVCAEERADCIDLASEVPHDARYFYDAAHFTEAGAELVAARVGAHLLESGDWRRAGG